MPTRREVERAVLYSQLEPTARLLVLALLVKAHYDTAVIPPEHTPSLTTLCQMTGLGRSSVVEWLALLEAAGWVERKKPSEAEKIRGVRTQYALHCGKPAIERPARPSRVAKDKRASAHSGLPLERTADQEMPAVSESASAHSGPGVGRTAALASAHSGHATTKTSPTEKSPTKTKPSPAPSVPPRSQRRTRAEIISDHADRAINAGVIVGAYVEGALSAGKPMPAERLRKQVGRDAKALLDDSSQQPLLVLGAAWDMGFAGWSNLPVQLQRPTGRASPNGRHEPYRDPENQDDYDDWKAPLR